jgi:hypothetical protein
MSGPSEVAASGVLVGAGGTVSTASVNHKALLIDVQQPEVHDRSALMNQCHPPGVVARTLTVEV